MIKKLKCFVGNVLPHYFIQKYLQWADKRILVKQIRTHSEFIDDRRFPLKWENLYPCMHDNIPYTPFDAHYLFHPAWAARIVARNCPKKHIDISSKLFFSTMLSAFVPTELYEFQPSPLNLSGLICKHGDLMKLPFADSSVESLSCMHVVEHIGLGRYGDPLDPQGDIKAATELSRILAKNGTLLFVVPVGKPRLCFNAHRIYSWALVKSLFPNLVLKSCAVIDDRDKFIENFPLKDIDNLTYGCGCFEFVKILP